MTVWLQNRPWDLPFFALVHEVGNVRGLVLFKFICVFIPVKVFGWFWVDNSCIDFLFLQRVLVIFLYRTMIRVVIVKTFVLTIIIHVILVVHLILHLLLSLLVNKILVHKVSVLIIVKLIIVFYIFKFVGVLVVVGGRLTLASILILACVPSFLLLIGRNLSVAFFLALDDLFAVDIRILVTVHLLAAICPVVDK